MPTATECSILGIKLLVKISNSDVRSKTKVTDIRTRIDSQKGGQVICSDTGSLNGSRFKLIVIQDMARGIGEGREYDRRMRSGLLMDSFGDVLHSTDNTGMSYSRPLPGDTLGGEIESNLTS